MDAQFILIQEFKPGILEFFLTLFEKYFFLQILVYKLKNKYKDEITAKYEKITETFTKSKQKNHKNM